MRRAKGWVAGLVVLIAGVFFGVSSWGAQIPLPRMEYEPKRVEFHRDGAAVTQDAEIPVQPWVAVYSFTDVVAGGVVLGMNVRAEFVPYKVELRMDGKRVEFITPLVQEFPAPVGAVRLSSPRMTVDIQPLAFREAGTHTAEVKVFPFRGSFWKFEFPIVVDPFDFYGSPCLESSGVVRLEYHVATLGGNPLPASFFIAIKGTPFGDVSFGPVPVSGDSVRVLVLEDFYDGLGGHYLETVLIDTSAGQSVMRNVLYPYRASLISCGGVKG